MLPTISRQTFSFITFFRSTFHLSHIFLLLMLLCWRAPKTKQKKKSFLSQKPNSLAPEKQKLIQLHSFSPFSRKFCNMYLFFATLFTHHHSSYHSLLLLLFYLSEYLITTVVSVGFTFYTHHTFMSSLNNSFSVLILVMNASVCEWSHLMCHVLDMYVVYFKRPGERRNTATLGTWSEQPLCMTSAFPRGERNWKLISFSISTLFMRISQRLGVDFREFSEDKHCENISCFSIRWCLIIKERVFPFIFRESKAISFKRKPVRSFR